MWRESADRNRELMVNHTWQTLLSATKPLHRASDRFRAWRLVEARTAVLALSQRVRG